MKNKYIKVNTAGEMTAVFTGSYTDKQRVDMAKFAMQIDKSIEQAAFLENIKSDFPIIRMMGNELSVNGTVAGVYVIMSILNCNKLKFKISVCEENIYSQKIGSLVSTKFPCFIAESISGNEITLSGMKYKLIKGLRNSKSISISTKNTLSQLAKNCPASGLIFFDSNKIQPLVYVKATNTYVWEQACGSGSIAYSLLSGQSKIEQPSGEIVKINRTKEQFIYQVKTAIYPLPNYWGR